MYRTDAWTVQTASRWLSVEPEMLVEHKRRMGELPASKTSAYAGLELR
jgi:hypothetical protein